jgi:pimeloyl-ACP methyl ester carboxylesterase
VLAPLVLVLAIAAAISWHFSSDVLVPDHSGWPADVTVKRVGARTVALSRDEDTERPGVYGLEWQAGHARIGAITRTAADSVTRRLSDVHGYLAAGEEVAIDPEVYAGDPGDALGLPFEEVDVPGELGPMPAWLVPPGRAPPGGGGSAWAIVVHGINGSPQVGLRITPALRGAGLSTLLMTYRNDLGAPASPDGLHHLGLTEWRDVEAAARFALERGARRLVLVGYSMGGSLVAQFMRRSPLAARVSGLVLDAPALDWRRVLSFNAEEMGLPGFSSIPLRWAIGARIDADWEELDAVAHPDALRLPILLFHGTDDPIVPISISDDLAAELPGDVTYRRVPGAGHCEAWNVDRALYEGSLRGFLARIGVARASPRRESS